MEKLLSFGRKIIPRRLFKAGQPVYHWGLAWAGALIYGLPSRSMNPVRSLARVFGASPKDLGEATSYGMKIIGVTGTKGKSTTVFLIAKIFEEAGLPVAVIGSLGYKIKEKEWPNNLKMTMPGRFKIQQFLYRAKKAGCKFVVLEVTSEGIKQKRHSGIKFDSAVLTNIYKEHIENHGSFENYVRAKEQLFKKTKHTHILNEDEPLLERFKKFKSNKKILYGWHDWEKLGLSTELKGDFNKYNILAAVAVAQNYGVGLDVIKRALSKVSSISGRMEFIDAEFKSLKFKGLRSLKFKVVVDYAHTPDSLEMVYKTLKQEAGIMNHGGRLICVLGAAGGGRDKWKRPEFGRIAAKYCDEIILTNEDPYDENPEEILEQIFSGISQVSSLKFKVSRILDRKEAVKKALTLAEEGDTVVITGKGSETSMAVAGGKKIPWSDKEVILKILQK